MLSRKPQATVAREDDLARCLSAQRDRCFRGAGGMKEEIRITPRAVGQNDRVTGAGLVDRFVHVVGRTNEELAAVSRMYGTVRDDGCKQEDRKLVRHAHPRVPKTMPWIAATSTSRGTMLFLAAKAAAAPAAMPVPMAITCTR